MEDTKISEVEGMQLLKGVCRFCTLLHERLMTVRQVRWESFRVERTPGCDLR